MAEADPVARAVLTRWCAQVRAALAPALPEGRREATRDAPHPVSAEARAGGWRVRPRLVATAVLALFARVARRRTGGVGDGGRVPRQGGSGTRAQTASCREAFLPPGVVSQCSDPTRTGVHDHAAARTGGHVPAAETARLWDEHDRAGIAGRDDALGARRAPSLRLLEANALLRRGARD